MKFPRAKSRTKEIPVAIPDNSSNPEVTGVLNYTVERSDNMSHILDDLQQEGIEDYEFNYHT